MISTQSLGVKRRTLSLPVLSTVSTIPLCEMPVTVVATDALSRDHLNVAGGLELALPSL